MVHKLLMLGAAPETHCASAAVTDAYRAAGLFHRWPVAYVATHGEGHPGVRASAALRGAGSFAALLAQHRRVALHVHTEAHGAFWRDSVYLGAALAAHCPYILHLHGGGYERFYDACSRPSQSAIASLLERAAWVAAPAARTLAWVRSVTAHARTVHLANPVPIPPIEEGTRQNLVLFLGRLSASHGIFDLLEAVSQLRAAVPDVRLACAGEGDRAAVARHAESLGIGDAVKFIGWVGPSGKRALFESAAAFAAPACEGMPTSLLEAMAAGVPAVAAPLGGVPEMVVDGVSGFLAAPGDVATLTRHLRRLLLDRALGARIGAAGRETVRLRCAPERALPPLEALYAEVGLAALGEAAHATPAADLRKAA